MKTIADLKNRIAEIKTIQEQLIIERYELEKALDKLEIKRFKTGRHYSDHGQRIAYAWVEGGILMSDVDRNINYFFPVADEWAFSVNRQYIMREYDAGRGQSVPYEHKDKLDEIKAEALKL